MSSTDAPAIRSASALAASIAGERARSGCCGDEHRIARVAPAAQVHAPIGRRSPSASARSCVAITTAPAMSTSITDDHVLRVRVADHAVVGPSRRRSRRPCARRGTRRADSRAAICVIGASISPIPARYSSRPTPRRARRALSNTANVSQAWNTSCATSIGSGGDSHGNGDRSAGANDAE